MCCTRVKELMRSMMVLFVVMLFFTSIAVRADAAWTDMNEDHQIWNIWGSAANDVIGVGCKGIILNYDGNKEGMWTEMLDTSHYA